MAGSKVFGTRLRDERKRRGLTQREAAARFEIDGEAIAQPSYYRWESGDTLPKEILWPTLASFLGCSIDELFKLLHNSEAPKTMAGIEERLASVERDRDMLLDEVKALREEIRSK